MVQAANLPSTGGPLAQTHAASGSQAPTGGGTLSSAVPSDVAIPMDQDWISDLNPEENLALSLWPADSVSEVVPVMEKLLGVAQKIEEALQPCMHSERQAATMIAEILGTFGITVHSTHDLGGN